MNSPTWNENLNTIAHCDEKYLGLTVAQWDQSFNIVIENHLKLSTTLLSMPNSTFSMRWWFFYYFLRLADFHHLNWLFFIKLHFQCWYWLVCLKHVNILTTASVGNFHITFERLKKLYILTNAISNTSCVIRNNSHIPIFYLSN